MTGFEQFEGAWGPNAELAREVLAMRPARGIPTACVHVMDVPLIEEVAGRPRGAYRADPHGVYVGFQRAIGTCALDQYLAENPLTMSGEGYGPDAPRGATTGAARVELDGIVIDSPEAVAEHLERHVFPALEREIAARARRTARENEDAEELLVADEVAMQRRLGTDILKLPYGGGFQSFPCLRYSQYGYESYLAAYAMFPELMERDFALQADLAVARNAAAARAIVRGGLARVLRLDHDMAGSRGTLVDIRSLDAIWFPHFARAIAPLLDAGVRPIWHCDGDLMRMVPRLIDAGIGGFQGFQYEDGVDYEAICQMTDREGGPLMIWAGVSVTRVLPSGTAADVAAQMRWLVEAGPERGLFLGASSSVAPGTDRANVRAMLGGLAHYRERGRGG